MVNTTIYDRISAECKLLGISINELEEKCGLKKNSIYKWNSSEKEANPKANSLIQVASVLHVSIDYLLGVSSIKEPIDSVIADEDLVMLQRINELPPEKQPKARELFNLVFETVK